MFKILVVEDDKELNRTVCAFLNQSGYEAVGCLNANDAYDEMYERVFDLIVSDIMMPGTDGFEFAKAVRSLNEEIPILFMTARDDIASKQRGYRVGIDDYMTKPIDLDELFLRIGALLRRAKIASSRKLEIGSFVMDAALVSMLSLETAMFSQFGKEMSQWGQRLMIILTGAGVSAVIITMSLYSIIKNTKELKKQYEQ